MRESCNPSWAACHLVRAIGNGLAASKMPDHKAALALQTIATYLGMAVSTPGSFEALHKGVDNCSLNR